MLAPVAAGTRQQRILEQRRQARWLGALGFTVALALPVVLFHRVVEILARQPKLELHYLSGWTPWLLLAGGLAFLLPVAWSAGMDPESRWFPRARAAYAGWGISLYLLGFLLAWQVARIQGASVG
jgi:hypothetical protein